MTNDEILNAKQKDYSIYVESFFHLSTSDYVNFLYSNDPTFCDSLYAMDTIVFTFDLWIEQNGTNLV